MASYPYSSSPPPPPPPCSNTTSPILQPPPPPPQPACNHTPPPAHYSLSPPSLSPPPCNCNKATPTLPPPHLPPPPSYYSPPSASLSPPPLPPPSPHRYSPPPPSSQPSPLSPEPPLCHCVCPSPWAISPNHYNSIPPHYYALAPSPLSSGNHQRTVIVTAFVSLGGVFFLSFIVIGLLSVAMKKKMFSTLRLSGGPEADPLSQEERQEPVREFQSIPAGTEPVMHDPKAQEVSAPPDEGVVKQGEGVQRIPSETKKKSVDPNVERDSFGDNQGKVDEKLGEPSSEQSGDKIEGVDEGKSNEGNNKPLDDRTDSLPDEESKSNTIPEESNKGASNESQKKPRVPKFKKAKGGKTGKEKHSGIHRALNATLKFNPDDMETQDDDNDQEQVSGTEAQDEDEKVEHPNEDEQEAEECDGKSPSDQTETNKTNSAQDVNEGSNNSEKKLRLPKENNLASNSANKRKGKHSSSSGVTKGKEQLFGVSQVSNPANIFYLGGAGNFQDGDNDEHQDDEETYELEPEDDDKEMIAGGSNRADEQELNERHGEPLSHHQSERYTRDSAQHVEEESSTLEEKSKDSKKILSLPKKKKPSTSSGFKKGKEESSGICEVLNAGTYFDQDDAPQDDNNDAREVTQSKPLEDDENLNSGGSNDTSEEVVPLSNADADLPNECEQTSLENQSESDSRGVTEIAEQESTAIKEESNDCSSKPLGNQSYSNNADATQDLEKPYATKEDSIYSKRKQALKKGRGSSSHSHLQGKIQYSNFGLLNEAGNVYSEAVQSQEDDNDGLQMEESELQHDDEDLNSGGNDSCRAMDDVEGEVKVSDLSASAQASKQALSKVVILDGGDYKDDKAKVHEMKSSSSKKDLQERQHRTRAKKNFNLGKIGTAASRRDPGMEMVSFDDEEDNVQESEPFASNVDSYLGQLQTSARGIEQSPNFFRNLTTKSDIDPVEELKSLGEGSYKGKKAEVQKLSKDSRRIKGQIKGPGTKIEPPKLSQIVTGRIDDDLGVLGKGMEYFGGNQGGSDKDGSGKEVTGSGRTSRGPQQISSLVQSMAAATDEGDPNPELEICEDDRELESDLSLQEPFAGEVEPSTEYQSVFMTAEDDLDVLQFLENEYDEEPTESNKDVPAGKPPPRRSHPQGKIKYSNFDQLFNETGDVYSEAVQSQEDDNDGLQMEESELQHDDEDLNSGGNDSCRAMVSLDDVEDKVKVPDLFASAQGSKQVLSKVMVLDGGDYKDVKAKLHEMKSSSSKKDLQERQHRTQAKQNFNLGKKIGTAASRRDPGMEMVSFDDEEDNVQESEPFASNVDSYLGQLQTSARGIEQSPNFFGNLTTKSDIDPVEELKSLGEGSYRGKKTEVQKLSKDSRRIKGQIKGPGTKMEPPKLSQIVTGRIDDDLGVLGKGLEYLGGNQEGRSDKDGSGKEVTGFGRISRGPQQIFSLVQSMAATDKGDPNPELEICEDDREMESDLSIQEPSAGEVEPSTEDQSVFVTAEDDSDVQQFLENEYDEEPAETNKDVPAGKPPPRPRATNLRGKRRA